MARLTKAQMIAEIEKHLESNPNLEVYVKDFQYLFRNGRYGLKAYSMVYDGTDFFCRPWAGANIVWRIPWFRLSAGEVKKLWEKILC